MTYVGVNDLYQINQYTLTVYSDGTAQVSGTALSSISYINLAGNGSSIFGSFTPVLDNPRYLLSAKQVHMPTPILSNSTDVYYTFTYDGQRRIHQMNEYLGTGTGTFYATTTYTYNSAGNIISTVKDAADDANDYYVVYTFASDGRRPISFYSKSGTTAGFGTDKLRGAYTFDGSLRLIEMKIEMFNSSGGTWVIIWDFKYSYNTDGTISEFIYTNSVEEDTFQYSYTDGNPTVLKLLDYDIEMTYTFNSYNLPASAVQRNGVAPGQHIHSNCVFSYDATFGLLTSAIFTPYGGDANAVSYDYTMNYDSSGRQVSQSNDNNSDGPSSGDSYQDCTYDANGNMERFRSFANTDSASGSPSAYGTFTWVTQ